MPSTGAWRPTSRRSARAGSTMLLSPDNDFFRFFNDPSGIPSLKK